jgi:hypothetical protein
MRLSGPYAIAVGWVKPRAKVSTRNPGGTLMPTGTPAAGTASAAEATTAAASPPERALIDLAGASLRAFLMGQVPGLPIVLNR